MSQQKTITELLKEAEAHVTLLSESLPLVVDPAGISLHAKIPYKVICYREALIWRTEELAKAAYINYTKEYLSVAITLTRAMMEGAAAVWYLHEAIKKAIKSKSVEIFDDKIMRMLMGSKNNITDLEAINVLSFIDAVEKEIPKFRNCYESLCEYSHPNWSGTSFLYSQIDHDKILTMNNSG